MARLTPVSPRNISAAAVTQSQAKIDHDMMGIALVMARLGLGTTAPNPSVGAVLVDPESGEVIARGTTDRGGRPHAEPVAIVRAGGRARGATMYVTLEPCSHTGKTPPCADAIIASGVKRVVAAIQDPDPRVAGRGLARLRAAGITVSHGLRAGEAHALTFGHIARVTERRPLVQLKLALGPDGCVPQGTGQAPVFVTGLEARAAGHLLRAQADAIMVGHGTVSADNPDLTCRLPGLAGRSPVRVVLAREGVDLAGTRLSASADRVPLLVVVGQGLGAERAAAMTACGARVLPALSVGGRLWLPSVLEMLAAEGITRLLVEGGPALWRSFAEAGIADEVVVFIAQAARPDWQGDPLTLAASHLGALPHSVVDVRSCGADLMVRLRVSKPCAERVAPWSALL